MGKAPKAPNPITTANAQTASNRETAVTQANLNMMNQSDGQGNTLSYDQIGQWSDGTPRYQATQSLSPAGQALQSTTNNTVQNLATVAQDQSSKLGSLLSRDVDFSGLPSAGGVVNGPQLQTGIAGAGNIQTSLGSNDFSGDRQRVEDAMFQRLNPQIDRQRQEFETSLTNRGIRPGSSAYSQQMSDFNSSLNDQRTSILLNAGQEQNRQQQLALNSGNFANAAQAQQYGQNSNNAQFGNAALQQMYGNQVSASNQQNALRQQGLNEMLTQRSLPLNELLAVSGQAQVQTPQFAGTPQTSVGGTDVAGITNSAYANQMSSYNANQKVLGGLFDAGAGLFSLSDRRAKTDISKVGQTMAGTPIYKFRYKHGGPTQIGYMAQDLLETQPHAVTIGPDGLYRVNYGDVA